MARDPIGLEAAACTSCGTKMRADAERCPRCRAPQTTPGSGNAAANGRSARSIGAVLAGATLMAVVGVWYMRQQLPAPGAGLPVHAATAAPAAVSDAPPSPASPAPEPPERPFLDPAGAGAVAYAAGDYATALEKFKAAVERNPRDAESLSNLGQVLVRLGKPEEALPFFRRAIAEIPDRWAYHFNLARALGLLERWDESIATYRAAQRLFPDDYATAFNLGRALYKAGRHGPAVDEYKKAIALAPEDGSFRFALALAYERLERPADAAAAYGEYLRLSPDAPDGEKVRARISQLTGAAAPGASTASPR